MRSTPTVIESMYLDDDDGGGGAGGGGSYGGGGGGGDGSDGGGGGGDDGDGDLVRLLSRFRSSKDGGTSTSQSTAAVLPAQPLVIEVSPGRGNEERSSVRRRLALGGSQRHRRPRGDQN